MLSKSSSASGGLGIPVIANRQWLQAQDFGDHPLGRFAPAASPPRAGEAVDNAAATGKVPVPVNGRASLAPPGTRRSSEDRFMDGLEASSRAVGDLLGGLARVPKDTAVTAQFAGEALVAYRGVLNTQVLERALGEDVFKARVAHHIKALTPAQLLELRGGLERFNALVRHPMAVKLAGHFPLLGAACQDLEFLQALVLVSNSLEEELQRRLDEIGDRALYDKLEQYAALASRSDSPGDTRRDYKKLGVDLAQAASKFGQDPACGQGMLMKQLGRLYRIRPDHVRAFLAHLTPGDLQALAEVRRVTSKEQQCIRDVAQDCIAEAGVREATARLRAAPENDSSAAMQDMVAALEKLPRADPSQWQGLLGGLTTAHLLGIAGAPGNLAPVCKDAARGLVLSRIESAIGELGQHEGASAEHTAAQARLVSELGALHASGLVDDAGAAELLKGLPDNALRAIANRPDSTPPRKLAADVAVARQRELGMQMLESMDALLASEVDEIQRQPAQFTERLSAIVGDFDRCRTLCTGADGVASPEPRVLAKIAQVASRLDSLLSSEAIPLRRVPDRQLHGLALAIARLGVEDHRAGVSRAIQQRQASNSPYMKEAAAAIHAVGTSNLGAALAALKSARFRADLIKNGHQLAGWDAQQCKELRSELLHQALQALPPEKRKARASEAISADVLGKILALENMVATQLQGRPDAQREVAQYVAELQQIHQFLVPGKRQSDSSGSVSSVIAASAALRAIHIDVGSANVNVRDGEAGEKAQALLDANLAAMMASAGNEQLLPDGSPTGVCREFWADLARTDFFVLGKDGVMVPLLPRSSQEGRGDAQIDQRRSAAVKNLGTWLGEDFTPALLMEISRAANLNAMAGIQQVLMSPDSPIRTENDEPAMLVGQAQSRSSFVLHRLGDRLRVLPRYEIDATHIVPAGAEREERMIPLAEGGARFSYPIELDPKKGRSDPTRVRVESSLKYRYEAIPEVWKPSFPRPRTLADVLGPNAPAAATQAFLAHCATGRSTENIDFVRAVQAFKANPGRTFADAQAIARRFIAADAPTRINVGSEEFEGVLNLLASGSESLPAPQLQSAFDQVFDEVWHLAARDVLPRFIAEARSRDDLAAQV